VNARHALERQWAALIVRQPAARHVLLKWLAAYRIDPHSFQIEDAQASLMVRAVITLNAAGHPIDTRSVAAYLAGHDFSLTADEAVTLVTDLVTALPEQVDVERMALAVLATMWITFPEPDVADYLADPLGRRADLMQARKVRVQA
jgi:exosome complex RNA-binding protein Rrp42 (RNase PH superfamily)